MSPLTRRQLKGLFYTIEINLLLWLCVGGVVWQSSAELFVKQVTIAGLAVAAVLQHWAYYNLYRKAKDQTQKAPPNHQNME